MEAPDKIYLLDYQALGMSHSWYDKPQIVEGIMIKPENVEYIRKDALLEWTKSELENARNTDFDEFGRGEVITWERIIDKINSL